MDYSVCSSRKWLAFFSLLGACSSGVGTPLPYGQNEATLIGQNRVALTALGPGCDTPECEAVRQACDEDAAADVVLDESGLVLDVLCYEQDLDVLQVDGSETGDLVLGNRTVLVLGDEVAGAEVVGEVVIEGNNSVIYGHGPDISVLDGPLSIDKNNAIVRGTRILGDVTITKNNAQLSFCVIEGNLTITGNNTTLAECEVHGDVEIRGLNTVLVQNRFAERSSVSGFNLRCDGNQSFEDTNEDAIVDDTELSGDVNCEPADGQPSPQSAP